MKLRVISNPPNPYESRHAELLEPAPLARLRVYEEKAASLLTRNDSPDVPFTWSVNPYRGCQHGCAYCYARPYHEYLGFGAGTDFETQIVAKINAPELLDRELSRRVWTREAISFSGITDCYQPVEAGFELTRRCLDVCLRRQTPVAVITRSFLVTRDAELLAELAATVGARACISIPFADPELTRLIEPQAPPPARRFEAIRRLTEAGVPVGVLVSPVIPGLNDEQVPQVLQAAAAAGARAASFTALRLPGSVEAVFIERLTEALPLRVDRVLHRLREVRRGALNDSRFGHRMRGSGPYWDSVVALFNLWRDKLGLGDPGASLGGGTRSAGGCTTARAAAACDSIRSKPATAQLQFPFESP